MLDESKVDDIFSDFLRAGNQNGSDDIKQIYETLPFLNDDQQRVLTVISTMAVKYNSPVLKEMTEKITKYASGNRKTGFRFTRLIESYSLYKHFKGYQASAKITEDSKP